MASFSVEGSEVDSSQLLHRGYKSTATKPYVVYQRLNSNSKFKEIEKSHSVTTGKENENKIRYFSTLMLRCGKKPFWYDEDMDFRSEAYINIDDYFTSVQLNKKSGQTPFRTSLPYICVAAASKM